MKSNGSIDAWNQIINSTAVLRFINTTAVRKAKIVYNFGLSECNGVKNMHLDLLCTNLTLKAPQMKIAKLAKHMF